MLMQSLTYCAWLVAAKETLPVPCRSSKPPEGPAIYLELKHTPWATSPTLVQSSIQLLYPEDPTSVTRVLLSRAAGLPTSKFKLTDVSAAAGQPPR